MKTPTNTMKNYIESTPVLKAGEIQQRYIGPVETAAGYYELAEVTHPEHGRFLVAGCACNAGLLTQFARAYDPDAESIDEALAEFVADLEDPEHPSGELLAWHGSMVI